MDSNTMSYRLQYSFQIQTSKQPSAPLFWSISPKVACLFSVGYC